MNRRRLAILFAGLFVVAGIVGGLLADISVSADGVVTINGNRVWGGIAYVDELRATGSSGLKLYDDSGTAGVFVKDGGNVGIKESDPDVALQVTGDISATGTITGTAFDAGDGNITNVGDINADSVSPDSTTLTLGETDNDPSIVTTDGAGIAVSLGSSSGDDFNINSGGFVYEGDTKRVGIGTTEPTKLLHTYKSSNGDNELLIENPNTGTAARAMLRFQTDTGSSLSAAMIYHGSNHASLARHLRIANFDPAGDIRFYFNGGDKVVFQEDGDVGINDTTPDATLDVNGTIGIDVSTAATNFDHLLYITDNYTDAGLDLPANTAGIYSYGGELFGIDAGGTSQQLTSHPKELNGRFGSKSCNYITGECVLIDIEAAIVDLEKGITGGSYITRTHMSEDAIVSWYGSQQTEAATINAQRLAEAAAVLTVTPQVDAVESYPEMVTVPVSPTQYITITIATWEFDPTTGQPVTTTAIVTETVMEEVETGETLYRLKAGCQLEEETGGFLCPVGEEDAVYEKYVPQEMPAWMQARITSVFLTPQDVSGLPIPDGIEHEKLMDIGSYTFWWVKGEIEKLKELHEYLWAESPTEVLGAIAAVETFGSTFYDERIARGTGMTAGQFVARRGKIAAYLAGLGYDTTQLETATTEHALIEGICVALGKTLQDLWAAME